MNFTPLTSADVTALKAQRDELLAVATSTDDHHHVLVDDSLGERVFHSLRQKEETTVIKQAVADMGARQTESLAEAFADLRQQMTFM